jgi:hypothetical protein
LGADSLLKNIIPVDLRAFPIHSSFLNPTPISAPSIPSNLPAWLDEFLLLNSHVTFGFLERVVHMLMAIYPRYLSSRASVNGHFSNAAAGERDEEEVTERRCV